MNDILQQIMNMIENTRTVPSISSFSMIGFTVLLIFGVINCILGYRLLRFWMMLCGFVIGAGIGFGAAYTGGVTEKYMYAAFMVGAGVLLAVIAFVSYKIGIFILGAGIGIGLGIYVFHPTTSLVFFFCLLLGVGLGVLAMKQAREVLIIGTSLLGGAMAGFSAAKLGGLADIPYGLGLSAGFALLGMLIQFATNRRVVIEEEEYEPERVKKVKRNPGYRDSAEYPSDRRAAIEEESGCQRKPKSRETNSQEYAPARRKRVVDVPLENKKTRRTRQDEQELDLEGTVVYRPKRSAASADRTVNVRSGNVRSAGKTRHDIYEKDRYDDYYDDYDDGYYDREPIDEELLDEQVIQEMMDEDDREGEEIWNKISRKNTKKNTGRNKNAR